jgi:hypothetical protein
MIVPDTSVPQAPDGGATTAGYVTLGGGDPLAGIMHPDFRSDAEAEKRAAVLVNTATPVRGHVTRPERLARMMLRLGGVVSRQALPDAPRACALRRLTSSRVLVPIHGG